MATISEISGAGPPFMAADYYTASARTGARVAIRRRPG